MALANHENFEPLTFSVFMRWWMQMNGKLPGDVSNEWGLKIETINDLILAEIIPHRNPRNVKFFSKAFGVSTEFAELVLLGRKDLVMNYIETMAQRIMGLAP